MDSTKKNAVEELVEKFSAIPRIEETGPKEGKFNGEKMAHLARRSRLIYAALCVVGLIPLVLKLCAVPVAPQLVAMGFGCLVPGGGFVACGGLISILFGLFTTWYLWKKKGMWLQDVYGTVAGIVGVWLFGILGGLLARPGLGGWLVCPDTDWPVWGWILTALDALVLWGQYELRIRRTYRQICAGAERAHRDL